MQSMQTRTHTWRRCITRVRDSLALNHNKWSERENEYQSNVRRKRNIFISIKTITLTSGWNNIDVCKNRKWKCRPRSQTEKKKTNTATRTTLTNEAMMPFGSYQLCHYFSVYLLRWECWIRWTTITTAHRISHALPDFSETIAIYAMHYTRTLQFILHR